MIRAAGTLTLVVSGVAACGAFGEPDAWNTHTLQVEVGYDTLPDGEFGTGIPLQVRFDTLTNSAGHPIVHVRVTATNLSDRPLVGSSGYFCNWMFQVHDNADRAGDAWWSESLNRPCRHAGLTLRLPPGATQEFPRRFIPLDSIAATGGPRTYYFSARLRGSLEGDGPASRWLTDWIPAGSVELVP